MKTTTITIAGFTGTGKSTLALAIADLLNSNGIKSDISPGEDEGGPMLAKWKSNLPNLSEKINVKIVTQQLIRNNMSTTHS